MGWWYNRSTRYIPVLLRLPLSLLFPLYSIILYFYNTLLNSAPLHSDLVLLNKLSGSDACTQSVIISVMMPLVWIHNIFVHNCIIIYLQNKFMHRIAT